MDIKYVHIHSAQRNALLTVIDVFSRKVLIHMLRFNIKKGDVILLLSLLLLEYKIQNMTIRNDNGSQFIAYVVREFLKDKGVNQEFTHVATPEEMLTSRRYTVISSEKLLNALNLNLFIRLK